MALGVPPYSVWIRDTMIDTASFEILPSASFDHVNKEGQRGKERPLPIICVLWGEFSKVPHAVSNQVKGNQTYEKI